MNRPIEIRAERQVWNQGIALRIGYQEHNQKDWNIALPLAFEKVQEGAYIEPCLTLRLEDAQNLMDELWQCGLRPTEGTGSAGALIATQKHLEDMRRLVFSDAYKPLKG